MICKKCGKPIKKYDIPWNEQTFRQIWTELQRLNKEVVNLKIFVKANQKDIHYILPKIKDL